MESFKFLKPQITNAFNMIKGAVGLGKSCCCDDESPKVGGRRRSKMVVTPMRDAPSDQHVATMPYETGGASVHEMAMKIRKKIHGKGLIDDLMMEQKKRAMKAQGGRRVGGAVEQISPGLTREEVGSGRRRVGGNMVEEMMKMTTPRMSREQQQAEMEQRHMMERSQAERAQAMEKMAKGGRSCGGRKPSARGAIVKQVMQQHGLSLPQASKYVKEHGLY
jgi:hypothetical protein